jgi:2,3-bisphosphoglycerate-dependent phosphoglycerate mutase
MPRKTNPSGHLSFIFLRHGESIGNAEKRHQGQADYPLTDLGVHQAEQLAEAWKTQGLVIDRGVSSPLARAKQTAKIISKALGFKISYNPIWKERDNGKLAGLLHSRALEVLPPPEFIPLYDPIAYTGESQWELYLRAGSALNSLMSFPPGQYLVISHGGLLNMMMHALVGIIPQPNFQGPNFQFSNTGYTTVRYEPENGNWIILEHNNTSHLSIT